MGTKIIRALAGLAAIAAALVGATAAPAGAAPEPDGRASFKLGMCGLHSGPTDYGRGLRLADNHQVVLSIRRNAVFTVHWVSTPGDNGHNFGVFTLASGGRYLRVSATHAWMGTIKQQYAVVDGYGDACGFDRKIHLGLNSAGTAVSDIVWTARAKVLRAEPSQYRTDDGYNGSVVLRQIWEWVDH